MGMSDIGRTPLCFIVSSEAAASLAGLSTDRAHWRISECVRWNAGSNSLCASASVSMFVISHMPSGTRFLTGFGEGMEVRNWLEPCPDDEDAPCGKMVADWAMRMLTVAIEGC